VEYKPILDAALARAEHPPARCVLLQREQAPAELTPGRDLDWRDAMAAAEPVDWVPVAATDPLYVLYTSGTTGKPKGIVRDNGGHTVALLWSMPNVFDVRPGDVYWAASDVGWVVGHSYIVFQAPIRFASAPSASAPPNARNCTIRMVGTSTSSESFSSLVPYTAASVTTVWMPSL